MRSQTALDLTLWMVNLALGATFILVVTWFATRTIRKNAGVRHAIWVAGFAAILFMPVFSALIRPAKVVPVSVPAEAAYVTVAQAQQAPDRVIPATAQSMSVPKGFSWQQFASVSLLLWTLGIILAGLRLLVASLGIRSICRNSSEISAGEEISLLASRLGLRRKVRLRISGRATPPAAMTWGTRSPVILLPHNSGEWTPERKEAVLLHELAHIRRLDCLTQALAQGGMRLVLVPSLGLGGRSCHAIGCGNRSR